MNIEPAHVDQIRQGSNGRMVLIDADVAGVAADLRDIDPNLKVRFAEDGNPPYWVVFEEFYDEDARLTQRLVLTAVAHQTESGTWAGLDQRIVDRVREIDAQSRSGYDFVSEVERQNLRAEKEKRERRHERFGEHHEKLAHAFRKDRGVKNRAFIGRDM